MTKKMLELWVQKNKKEGLFQRSSALSLYRVQAHIWQCQKAHKATFIYLE